MMSMVLKMTAGQLEATGTNGLLVPIRPYSVKEVTGVSLFTGFSLQAENGMCLAENTKISHLPPRLL